MFHPHRISPRAPGTTRREGPVATFRMFKIFQEFVPRLFVSSKSVFRIGNGPFRKSSGIGGSYSVPKKAEARFPKSFHQLQDVCVLAHVPEPVAVDRHRSKLNSHRLASNSTQHPCKGICNPKPTNRVQDNVMYVVHGGEGGNLYNELRRYNPSGSSWSTLFSCNEMPTVT